ncbi:MAG: DUF5663 domain-containing protein [Candidatus Saccharimonadales bacterium]
MEPLITPTMLAATGIDIKDEDVEAYLEHLNTLLTERIGEAITESLSEENIEALSLLQETASDEELGKWLNTNVPDLDQIIQDEIDIVLGEAVENSDEINSLEES